MADQNGSLSLEQAEQLRRQAFTKDVLSIAKWEARTRIGLAFLLVFGVFFVTYQAVNSATPETAQQWALLLTPLVGLAGIAIGYFYGHSGRIADYEVGPRRANDENSEKSST